MKVKKFVLYATSAFIALNCGSCSVIKSQANDIQSEIRSYIEDFTDDDFLVTAHRGFSSLEVENTKEAISLASTKDYIDYIEVDARMTKDHKIILSHNNVLMASFLQTFDISNMTYEEVMNQYYVYNPFPFRGYQNFQSDNSLVIDRNRHLLLKRYHLVGLQEGLDACGDKKVLLDLKFREDIPLFVEELKSELDGYDTSNITFQSLDLDGISYLQKNSDFDCLALINTRKGLDRIDEFSKVGIKYTLLTSDLVEKIFQEGKELAIWTINSRETLDSILPILGEHYKDVIYITDYPDLISMRLNEVDSSKKFQKVLK